MNNPTKSLADWLSKNGALTSAAAIIIALGAVLVDWRQENRIDYQDVLRDLSSEITRLRGVERNCTELMMQYGREISDLRTKIVMLESAQMSSPLPMWLKSTGTDDRPGVMLAVNRAYEDMFLLPFGKTADDYIGRTDAEIWGDALGSGYWENDLSVIRSGNSLDILEVNPLTDKRTLRVIKYPRMYNGRIIGIAGIAIID